jgi:hypothetical protein
MRVLTAENDNQSLKSQPLGIRWGTNVEQGTHLTMNWCRNVNTNSAKNHAHESREPREGVNLSINRFNPSKVKRLSSRTHIVHR